MNVETSWDQISIVDRLAAVGTTAKIPLVLAVVPTAAKL